MGKSQKSQYIKATVQALKAKGYSKLSARAAAYVAWVYFKRGGLEQKTRDHLNSLTEEEVLELKKKLDSGIMPEF